jgi:hypothetical protein
MIVSAATHPKAPQVIYCLSHSQPWNAGTTNHYYAEINYWPPRLGIISELLDPAVLDNMRVYSVALMPEWGGKCVPWPQMTSFLYILKKKTLVTIDVREW